jgi:hypothetical protein
VNISVSANQTKTAIRAELFGTSRCHCPVAGLFVCAYTPILEMCRQLIAAGYHPDSRLLCFRGGILSLTIRSIGEAAQLKVNSKGTGFERLSGVRMTSPVRKSRPARTLGTPTTIQSDCRTPAHHCDVGEYRVAT